MTESPENIRPKSFFYLILSLPLRFKISIPYLIVASLFAGLATYLVGRSFVATLEDRFRNQLEDATYRTVETIIDIEAQQLQTFRTIAFTIGVPDAVLNQSAEELDEVVYPQIVNAQFDFVDILDRQGNLIASWHRIPGASEYRRNEAGDYQNWQSVEFVVSHQVDAAGDKFVEIVDTPWGVSFYTVGPIRTDTDWVGVLLVGTSFETMIRDLTLTSLANVSLYRPDGRPLFSSFELSSLPDISPEILGLLPGVGQALQTRRIEMNQRGYIEAVESLFLRGQPTDWVLGISLSESLVRENQGATAWQLLATFLVGILALIGLGVVVAQMISRPISNLVQASQEVGTGNLDIEVDVESRDEIGLLASGFNSMVAGLRQREFIREMFGRMVSEDVSEAVLQQKLKLGGEAHQVTVLFTDVRGFTSLTESEQPEEVISLLNEFFNIVTAATHRCKGAVNHFGGDSVLAVFGAPIKRPIEETVQQAISAAIEIFTHGVKLNARRISQGLPPVRFGIGVNSGFVVAGNIGSENRFTYTVIGDVVNIAARLQGISREFPVTPVLVPEHCIEMAGEVLGVSFLYLNDFMLKGKTKPVSTYAILGRNDAIPPNFDVFTKTVYADQIALLACYLYCLGYSQDVVAPALEVETRFVEKWLLEASQQVHIIAPILVKTYDLPAEALQRLQTDD